MRSYSLPAQAVAKLWPAGGGRAGRGGEEGFAAASAPPPASCAPLHTKMTLTSRFGSKIVLSTSKVLISPPQRAMLRSLAAVVAVLARAGTTVGRSQCAHAPPYPECDASYPRQHAYSVAVLERDPYHGRPLISKANGQSEYAYNFNGPWFPPPLGSGATDGLIVQVQEDWRLPNATHPEWTDTGALTVSNIYSPF